MAEAAEPRRLVRAPACLCVLCGLPAAGKSTLARRIVGTAAELGWRAAVVPYDDLIPEQAFHTEVDDVKLQDMVGAQTIHAEFRGFKIHFLIFLIKANHFEV